MAYDNMWQFPLSEQSDVIFPTSKTEIFPPHAPTACYSCGVAAKIGDVWRFEILGGVIKEGHASCFGKE